MGAGGTQNEQTDQRKHIDQACFGFVMKREEKQQGVNRERETDTCDIYKG